ncbi:MAG TPA: DUF5777 family beta-barrel protein [Chitinophagaceae bacterium]
MHRFFSLVILAGTWLTAAGQDDLLSLVDQKEQQKKLHITNAFKSSRVINSHSIEFIGKGIMDVRILHRFGELNSGFNNLFGLDQANMRFGFDFGILNSLTVGFGRSNIGKEWDGFIKFRPVWQSTGPGSLPVSIVVITGATLSSQPWSDPARKNYFSSRMAFYHELIIGRKFNSRFSLQSGPFMVHRNIVQLVSDENDTYGISAGGRFKLSKRIALVVDYHHIIKGLNKQYYKDPLSVGIDIETGGHVFQLHFSNSSGMNEKAFITNTTGDWSKGAIRFGFNMSRVFTVSHKRNT